MNPDEIPFSTTVQDYAWLLLTPAEKRVTALSLKVTMLVASGALDMPDVQFTPDDLALLAELHARIEEKVS